MSKMYKSTPTVWLYHTICIFIIYGPMKKNNTPLTEMGSGRTAVREMHNHTHTFLPQQIFLHPRVGQWLTFEHVERQFF